MPITKDESKKIQQFAQEGKQTKRIREDHFPHLSYAEVAAEVRDWGERSALGRMRMITGGSMTWLPTITPRKELQLPKSYMA